MTARIQPLSGSDVPARSQEILTQVESAIGMVPNLHRTLAQSPAALRSYSAMVGALSGGILDPKLRESIALATAAKNGCSYCASAHTVIGRGAGIEEDELTRNLSFGSSDPKTLATLAFVEALLAERGAVTDGVLDAARHAGLSDPEIVEVVAHVAMNTFTNTLNNLAHTEVDFPRVEFPAVA